MSDRPCTCHPDDNPPVPCPQKFALSECRASLPPSGDTSAQLAEYLASGARLVEAFHQLPGVARAMREAACLLGKSETHPAAPAPEPVAWLGRCPDGSLLVTTDIAESGQWLDRGDVIVGDLYAVPVNAAPGYCPHCKQYTIAEPLPAPAAPDAKTTDEIMAIADRHANGKEKRETLRAAVEQLCAENASLRVENSSLVRSLAMKQGEWMDDYDALKERAERAERDRDGLKSLLQSERNELSDVINTYGGGGDERIERRLYELLDAIITRIDAGLKEVA